ncbi:PAS domain-containing sensor histidine kinase [Derxia lacustris]|uniref:PAS domain-containing sensor histidine kinase n=1 Tax=Derxia lacustris TaxID=764842 RepID=UPI0015946349|nr:hybrid sensor histidine kinase/response regulator [Derxia lacustris]
MTSLDHAASPEAPPAAAAASVPDTDAAPRRARGLTWIVIGLTSLICALFVLLHFHQRQAIREIAISVEGMRLARIELAHALDAAQYGDDSTYRRDQALDLAHQAVAGLAVTLSRLPDNDPADDAGLPDDIERLSDQIEAWRSATVDDFGARARLRAAFHRVEQRADHIDERARAHVRQLDAEQASQFRAAAVFALLLLLGIGAIARSSARAQRESERALINSRRLFETLARISPVGIYRTNAFGNEVYANERCRDIRGLPPGEAGRGLDEHVHPDDRERVRARWRNAVEDMRGFHDEYRLLHPDGSEVWVLNQAVPEVSADRTVLGYVGTLTDITARKRAELLAHGQRAVLELIASGQPVDQALDALLASIEELDPELICLVTRHGPDRDSAPVALARRVAAEPLLALQASALAARTQVQDEGAGRDARLRARNTPVFLALGAENGEPALPAGSLWYLALADDSRPLGSFAVFRRAATPPGAAQLNVIETAAHTAAICLQRHRDEAALRSSEQRFRQLAQSLPQLVWSGRPDGRCDFLGRQWAEFTGQPTESLLGFEWFDRIHPDDRPMLRATWEAAHPTEGLHTELRLRRHDGSYRWFDVRALPLLDDGGRVLRWFGTGTDVTESRALRDALHRANTRLELKVAERTAELSLAKEAAEASNRLKSEFLASMSHELRTPLHAILGFTDMLLRGLPGPLNPAQTRQLGNVHTSARHLLSLINDLLDVARVESGKTQLSIAPLDAGAIVADAVEVLRPTASSKGLDLQLALPAKPAQVLADRRALTQIVINLLGNAIKFTDSGWVRIEVALAAGQTVIAVADSGCGIAPEDQARLFQAFTQAEPGRHHSQGGTGLGLYLCRRLADEQGGSIALDSAVGHGSRFTLRLPTPAEGLAA